MKRKSISVNLHNRLVRAQANTGKDRLELYDGTKLIATIPLDGVFDNNGNYFHNDMP